jgi:hypothetical protein
MTCGGVAFRTEPPKKSSHVILKGCEFIGSHAKKSVILSEAKDLSSLLALAA